MTTPEKPRTPGQLWQREAERDVATHGEPRPRTPHLSETARLLGMTPREYVDALIENRRPAIRLRHAMRRSSVTAAEAGRRIAEAFTALDQPTRRDQ